MNNTITFAIALFAIVVFAYATSHVGTMITNIASAIAF